VKHQADLACPVVGCACSCQTPHPFSHTHTHTPAACERRESEKHKTRRPVDDCRTDEALSLLLRWLVVSALAGRGLLWPPEQVEWLSHPYLPSLPFSPGHITAMRCVASGTYPPFRPKQPRRAQVNARSTYAINVKGPPWVGVYWTGSGGNGNQAKRVGMSGPGAVGTMLNQEFSRPNCLAQPSFPRERSRRPNSGAMTIHGQSPGCHSCLRGLAQTRRQQAAARREHEDLVQPVVGTWHRAFSVT